MQLSPLLARPGRGHVTMTTLFDNFITAVNKQTQGNDQNRIDHL
ncbi:hypothetical protein F385_3465 [Pantoea agglomerans 299R]|nr:hypothetical protein F385_3465 [Pantoea agglomerans 299R]